MEALQAPPNNGSPNFGTGLYTMPMAAPSSEADGCIDMSGIIRIGGDESTDEAAPQAGGNDGNLPDKLIA